MEYERSMVGDTKPDDREMGERVKRERELRLALVCYGGVSLAVYMLSLIHI